MVFGRIHKNFVLIALTIIISACSSTAATTTAATTSTAAATASASAAPTVGNYTIYNATGTSVTGLYLYPTDSTDKGTNLAGDKGFKAAHALYATYDNSKGTAKSLTLEFTTDKGYTGTFTTLSIETAPISLIAEDAKTGATAIQFAAAPATYTIVNSTGEEVKSLYMYATGSTTKGDNKIGDAAKADGQVVITVKDASELIKDGKIGTYTLEFTTASCYTGTFTTLSYETAKIELIAESAKTGATAIKFGY